MHKSLLLLAGILGALAVGVGAFGAHGLKSLLTPDRLAIYQTGVAYHFYHVLALLGCLALSPGKQQGVWLYRAGVLFVLGIFLFSGSLYLLACRDVLDIDHWSSILGPMTPIGGVFFMLGWLSMAVHALRTHS